MEEREKVEISETGEFADIGATCPVCEKYYVVRVAEPSIVHVTRTCDECRAKTVGDD
jgi:hypothetical protein